MMIVKVICVLTGLIMFAKYHNCDPFLTKVQYQIYKLRV